MNTIASHLTRWLLTGLLLCALVTPTTDTSLAQPESYGDQAIPTTSTTDTLFTMNPAIFTSPGTINTLVPLSDGRTLIGGRFVSIGGQPTPRSLAILNSDGTVDTTFQVDSRLMVTEIYEAAVQSDGKIIIAGTFRVLPSPFTYFLLRLYPNGLVDETFNVISIGGPVFAVLVDEAKIVIGGAFYQPTPYVARLNPDGTADTTFNGTGSGPNGTVRDIARQQDGKYIIVGDFTQVNNTPQTGIARLGNNGVLDTGFVHGGSMESKRVAVLRDNSVVVGREDICGDSSFAWYTPDGVLKRMPLDLDPDPNWLESITTLVALPDGGFLIGGWYSAVCINGSPTQHQGQVWRYAADGRYRTMVSFGDNSDVLALAVRSDGHVVAGGKGLPARSSEIGIFDGLALLNSDYNGLERVPAFHPLVGDEATIYSISRYADGKLLIAGNFSHANGSPHFGLARLLANGTLDPDFYPFANDPDGYSRTTLTLPNGSALTGFWPNRLFLVGTNGNLTDISALNDYSYVTALAIQSDNKVLVGSWGWLRRLNADVSGTDPTFTIGNVNGTVYALAIQGNKIVVAGDFSSYNGVSVPGLLRLNSDGNIDNTFTPPAFRTSSTQLGSLYSITPLPAGDLMVGGFFTMVDSEERPNLVRLNNDGTVDTGFSSPTSFHTVQSTCLAGDGSLWVGGIANTYERHPFLTHLDRNGQIIPTTFPNTYQTAHYYDDAIHKLLCDANGLTWVSGTFSLIDGKAFYGLVRYVPLRSQVFLPQIIR
ncbi:delta-60 repeat domain-containing protein [Chloroflexus sp.]|uniref:delta-60 repeat domain-containing protein n=1 Tax=Chloroflexus sp. TaxID=1904827 RepID=UPI002ADDCBA3|nr:delta-60 repeat domain-containing protein [Chloroflexus sp.]